MQLPPTAAPPPLSPPTKPTATEETPPTPLPSSPPPQRLATKRPQSQPSTPPSTPHTADSPRPYPHQVGGHGQLTKANAGYLLKPSSEKEHAFYNYIHSHRLPLSLCWLRNVTPKYFGHHTIPVQLESNSPSHAPTNPAAKHQPNIHLTQPSPFLTPPANQTQIRKTRKLKKKLDPPRPPITSSHIPPPLPESDIHLADPQQPYPHPAIDFLASPPLSHPPRPLQLLLYPHRHSIRWRFNDAPETVVAQISPWAVQMDNRKKKSRKTHKRTRPCIKLEDVNTPFMLPCVLDCKMGIRHFDDDASDEKRRRHMHKARTTTSGKCGVRYTGMQSFKQTAGAGVYHVRDKYHGRTLAEKDLIPMATWFFHNGHQLRTDSITLMLDKLKNLRPYIVAQQHFYFYSSSLLLVYEGASPDLAPPRAEIRMIDFAHTVLSNGKNDEGYLHGLDYLIGILTTILQNDKTGKTVMARCISMEEAPPTSTEGDNAPVVTEETPGVKEALGITHERENGVTDVNGSPAIGEISDEGVDHEDGSGNGVHEANRSLRNEGEPNGLPHRTEVS